jgi:hypothetical protein
MANIALLGSYMASSFVAATVVGQDMGRRIGTHTVKTIMQPLR